MYEFTNREPAVNPLVEFLTQGKVGPCGIGSTVNELRLLLGPEEDKSDFNGGIRSMLKYGPFQFLIEHEGIVLVLI